MGTGGLITKIGLSFWCKILVQVGQIPQVFGFESDKNSLKFFNNVRGCVAGTSPKATDSIEQMQNFGDLTVARYQLLELPVWDSTNSTAGDRTKCYI